MRARAVIPSPTSGSGLRKKTLEPYKLTLRAAQSVQVPDALGAEVDRDSSAQLLHRLSASLFDTDERKFFGRTWESTEVPMSSKGNRATDVEHDVELYFHSPLNGARCVIVVEHVIVLRRDGGAVQEHPAGWCVLRPFDPSAGRLRDSSEGGSSGGRGGRSDDGAQPPMPFFQGSPLALLQLQPPYDRSPYLQRASASLVYILRTHRALRPAMHLLSPDVFYSTTLPIPGLLPSREPQSGRLLACPLSKPDTKTLQASTRMSATQIRVTIPASMETDLAKAAYAALQPPPPRGGRAPQPPAKVTTGQRRLLVALHSSYAILADKAAQNAPPPPPPSADGRQLTPPPGSLIAPKSVTLEEVKGGGRDTPPAGSIVLRSSASGSAALDGFVNSTAVALVVELQVEVTLPPPPGKQYERRTKFVPIAWGCVLPSAQAGRFPQLPAFPLQLRFDLRFGGMGKPCPLSFERVPSLPTGAKGAAFVPYAEAELSPVAASSSTLKQMERELENSDADEAKRIEDQAAASAAVTQPAAPTAAEKAFQAQFVEAPVDDRRDDRRADDRRAEERRADERRADERRRGEERRAPEERESSRDDRRGDSRRADDRRPDDRRADDRRRTDSPRDDRRDDRRANDRRADERYDRRAEAPAARDVRDEPYRRDDRRDDRRDSPYSRRDDRDRREDRDRPPSAYEERKLSKQEEQADKHYRSKQRGFHRRALFAWRDVAALSKACGRASIGRVDVHVHTLKFVSPPAEKFDTLWVTVHPLLTSKALSTRRLDRKNAAAPGGVMAIDFAESLELLPGAIGTRRLKAALASELDSDSTILYTLWGSSKEAPADASSADGGILREPLAEGSLSLRELWSGGADLVRSALPLFSQRIEVAELSITLHAVHAIRAVTAPPKQPSLSKAEAAVKTAPAPVAAGVVAAAAAPPAVRSSAELAMAELIATGGAPPYGEAQMVAVSSGVADRADRAMLWQASMRLGQVPLDGAAAAAAAAGIPAVAEDASEFGPEMAHNLLMQFVCFSSSEPTPPESIYLSFTLFHFDARTTPRAILMPPEDAKAASARAAAVDSGSGASASTAARPDAIVVDVRELNLGPQRRDAPWGHVAVEIEIPGVDPPPPPAGGYRPGQPKPALVRSKNAPKRGRRVDLGFSHVFDTPPGSSAASALAGVLNGRDAAGGGRVQFYLYAPAGRDGKMMEVGEGSVSLEGILSERKDVVLAPVQLHMGSEYVGSLTVSVYALAAMQRAQAEGRASAPQAGVGLAADADAAMSATSGREEDWMLVAADAGLAREGPGLVERFLVQPPGSLDEELDGGGSGGDASAVSNRSDGTHYAAVQSARFQRYLQHKAVCIDVWDGASLLQIGTARVPLAALLKKGTERVGAASVTKEYLSVDVLDTALTTIDAAPSADAEAVVTPALRGKLKLVVARLSAAVPSAVAKSSALARGSAVRTSGGSTTEAGGAVRQKVRMRALTDASQGSNIPTVKSREPTAAEEAALYRRQLRRQKQREWLRFGGGSSSVHPEAGRPLARSAEGLGAMFGAGGGAGSVARSLEMGMGDEHSLSRARLQLQQRSLRTAESYRESHREERLRFLLADQASLTRYVFPSYGTAELIELPFRNPYSEPHAFSIEWDDALSHLSLVHSVDEWRSLKALHGLTTPVEENLLLNGRQLWLQAQELVYIPIKYQGWQHGQVALHSASAAIEAQPHYGGGAGATNVGLSSSAASAAVTAAMPLPRRTVMVRVLNVKSETVGALEMRVRPQPYVIDQTFRFHQSEHEVAIMPARTRAIVRPPCPAPTSLPLPFVTLGSSSRRLSACRRCAGTRVRCCLARFRPPPWAAAASRSRRAFSPPPSLAWQAAWAPGLRRRRRCGCARPTRMWCAACTTAAARPSLSRCSSSSSAAPRPRSRASLCSCTRTSGCTDSSRRGSSSCTLCRGWTSMPSSGRPPSRRRCCAATARRAAQRGSCSASRRRHASCACVRTPPSRSPLGSPRWLWRCDRCSPAAVSTLSTLSTSRGALCSRRGSCAR